MRRAWAFVRLSRPHFLVGGAVMFAVGATTAPEISAARYLVGQTMVTVVQLTAHYANEYFDVDGDRFVTERTMFSGGSGVLTSGQLAPVVALQAGIVSSAGAAAAIAAVAVISPAAALIGVAALTVSWVYSAPPLRLAASGWGELVTSITVAALVPSAAVLVLGGSPGPAFGVVIALLVLVHGAMILTFELPDLASDARAGKRVLGVRLGWRRTVLLVDALMVAAFAGAGAAVIAGLLPAGTAAWMAWGLVPAAVTSAAIRRQRHAIATTAAVVTLVTVALGFVAGS